MHDDAERAHAGDGGGRGAASRLHVGEVAAPDQATGEQSAFPLATVRLAPRHRVADFVCARSPRVQDFLRQQADDFAALSYSRVFVWPDRDDPAKILGYYSLSSGNVARTELINKHERKVPKGLPVPIALLGYVGKLDGMPTGFGADLVFDAALRVANLREEIGCWGIALDAENEKLAEWYATLGFSAARHKDKFMYAPLGALLPS